MQFGAFAAVDHGDDRTAVGRPCGLAQCLCLARRGPQRLAGSARAIVNDPRHRIVAVGEDPPAVRIPDEMTNLTGARRKLSTRAAIDRAHAQESTFRVRKPLPVRRHRADRIAIPDRAVLMGSCDPGQFGSIVARRLCSTTNDQRRERGDQQHDDD